MSQSFSLLYWVPSREGATTLIFFDRSLLEFPPQEAGTSITPGAGQLSASGQTSVLESGLAPAAAALAADGQTLVLESGLVPGTGSSVLEGQSAVVPGGSADITPLAGQLSVEGRQPASAATSPPGPRPPAQTGGGSQPRRLPFWGRPLVLGSGALVGPPARLSAVGSVEEDELSGEENRVLELL